VEIVLAENGDRVDQARELFGEYWDSFGFTPCFQNFDAELRDLPGKYTPPSGRLALALVDDVPAGCVALRKVDDRRCELKRLYVRAPYRGRGLGLLLLHWTIDEARKAGYDEMLADTMPVMQRALGMYDAVGFERTQGYGEEPTPGAIYLRLRLT